MPEATFRPPPYYFHYPYSSFTIPSYFSFSISVSRLKWKYAVYLYPVLGNPPHCRIAMSMSQSISPIPREMLVPCSRHRASFNAESFLSSLRSLSKAISAICLFPIVTVFMFGLFQFNTSESLPLSRLASVPKWMLNMRCLKQRGELYSIRCHNVKWLSE